MQIKLKVHEKQKHGCSHASQRTQNSKLLYVNTTFKYVGTMHAFICRWPCCHFLLAHSTQEEETMAKGADTGWHDGPVGPSPSFIGVSPSNISRCLSSTPGLSTRGWLLAAILLVAGGSQRTGAYGTERTGDLGTAVVTEAPFTVDKTGGLFLMQGARKRHSAQAVDGSRFLAAELVDDCITSPLWDKEVDPAKLRIRVQGN